MNPRYPTPWEAHHQPLRSHRWRGVITRLPSPVGEWERKRCPHEHRSPGDALACAQRAAQAFNQREKGIR